MSKIRKKFHIFAVGEQKQTIFLLRLALIAISFVLSENESLFINLQSLNYIENFLVTPMYLAILINKNMMAS